MNKKLIVSLALACGTAFAASLAACGHEHTFSDKWSQSETEHWHEATCEHTGEKSGLGAHTDGNKDEKCDVCGYDMHVHKFSDGWESDETGHWHPATCGHEEVKDGFAAHVDSDNDGKCDACKYEPIDVTVGGTYYCFENGTENKELYIVFKNGKWSDDDGLSGDYKIFGNTVTLYTGISGEKIEFADGKVTGDDIVMDILGADITYRKGEDLDPNKPKDKTLSYSLNDDRTYYIVNGIGGLTGDIIIPDEYKNKPVKEIAENAFANCAALTSVEIGDGVEKIGKKAFYNCTALTTVKLGEKVAKIEESTFEKCKVLKSVTVSASVKAIDDKSFTGCSALENIYYTGTASDWVQIDFYYSLGSYSSTIANPIYSSNGTRKLYIGNQLLTDADLSDAAEIKPTAFYGCKQLKSVTTGGNLRTIGEYAFYGCTEITSLTLENGLTEIGVSAFNRCGNLASVSLPDSVKIIGKSAFNECENLTYAKIGNGVTYIAYGAFMGCENLSTLILGNSVAEICEGAFYSCNSLSSVTIPASAIFIGKEAFMYTALTEATFLNTSGWIANKNDALTDADLADTANAAKLLVNSVLDNGYAEAEIEKPTLQYTLSSDKTYYILNNVGTVSRSDITVPEKYKEIPVRALADNAFANCKSLKSISLPGCMKSIPSNAFSGCSSLQSIEVRGYLVGDFEEVYASSDGVLYNANFTQIICIPAAKTEVKLSGSIGKSMFANNLNLKKIVLTGGKSIGEYAFSGCTNLVEVILPDSLTSIGNNAFNGCTSLEKITIGSGLQSVNSFAFDGCNNLKDVSVADGISLQGLSSLLSSVVIDGGWSPHTYLKDIISYNEYGGALYVGNESNHYVALIKPANTDVKSVRIHADTQFIIGEAFYECENLTKVIMQNGLTAIGSYAFYNCENLTDVSVPDSVAFIGEYAFENCEKLKFNKDGENKYLGNASNPYAALIKADADVEILSLHKDVKVIATGALNNCGNIKELTIPDGLTSIDTDAINSGVLEKITVGDKNEVYSSQDGILYNKEMTEIILVPYSIKGEIVVPDIITDLGTHFSAHSYITSITIPDSVNAIGEEAFKGCSSLSEITLPDSLNSIGSSAFSGCSSLENIIIPDKVTSIGYSAFGGCNALKNLTIGKNVTSISNSAFSASSLESIKVTIGNTKYHSYKNCLIDNASKTLILGCKNSEIPSDGSVTKIGYMAFANCASLERITLPDSVTEIDNSAFYNCDNVTEINYKGEIDNYFKIKGLNNIISKTRTLLLNGEELTGELIIPDGTTSIPAYIFSGCASIESIVVPDSVTSIGSGAFYGCSGLKSITLPFVGGFKISNYDQRRNDFILFGYIFGKEEYDGSVETVQNYYDKNSKPVPTTFYLPAFLKSVTVNGGGFFEGAFSNCSGLTDISINNEKYVFYLNESENIFSGCSSLENLSIAVPENYSFGKYFGEESYESGVEVRQRHPQTLNDTYYYTYYVPASLKNVTVSSGDISKYSFENLTNLSSVTIGDGVTKINAGAFIGCTGLEMTLGSGAKTFEYKYDNSLSDNFTQINITDLKGWCESSGHSYVTSPDLKLYVGGNELSGDLIIPEGTTSIDANAFAYCTKITSVTVPNSVTIINNGAFIGCAGIKSMTLPYAFGSKAYSDDTAINPFASVFGLLSETDDATGFEKIESLKPYENNETSSVIAYYHVPSGLESVTITGGRIIREAFHNMSMLKEITLKSGVTGIGIRAFSGCKALTSVTVADGVTRIAEDAFTTCTNLKSVTLPASVTIIERDSFSKPGLGKVLQITFNGTKAQWTAAIANFWCGTYSSSKGTITVKCTDGNLSY